MKKDEIELAASQILNKAKLSGFLIISGISSDFENRKMYGISKSHVSFFNVEFSSHDETDMKITVFFSGDEPISFSGSCHVFDGCVPIGGVDILALSYFLTGKKP